MGEVVSGRQVQIEVIAPDLSFVVYAACNAIRSGVREIEAEQQAQGRVGRVVIQVSAEPTAALVALISAGGAFRAVRS